MRGYKIVLEISPLFKYYGNSIIVAAASTVFGVLTIAMGAYIIPRVPFKGSKAIVLMLSSTLLIPTAALLMPIYTIVSTLKLTDTKTGLTILYIALQLHMMSVWLIVIGVIIVYIIRACLKIQNGCLFLLKKATISLKILGIRKVFLRFLPHFAVF